MLHRTQNHGMARPFRERTLALALCLACLAAWLLVPRPGWCSNPRALFLQAQQCSSALMKDKEKQQYRDRWIVCIQGYLNVYKTDPEGPWAAAGLYEAGVLYGELYQRSRKHADQAEAVDLFERIVKRFPQSAYRQKAQQALADIRRIVSLKSRTKAENPPPVAPLPNAQAPVANAGPVLVSTKAQTLDKQALAAASQVQEEAQQPQTVEDILEGASSQPAQRPLAAAPDPAPGAPAPEHSGMNRITGLRFWSSKTYTRVVIDAEAESSFEHHLLKKDPSLGKPQRLFVDLKQARVSKDLDKDVIIQDDLLSGVRAAQYSQDTVRVVVDIKSFNSYKVFSLKNPFRIVIDVRGEKKENHVAAAAAGPEMDTPAEAGANGKVPPRALAKQLALGVSTIVIDPGHGGKDYGAPGAIKGVHEKHITLAVAKKLAEALRRETSCQVLLTREDDRFLTLEERTAIANTKNADLFISIHTNAHPNRSAYGTETYFLNLATDDESIRVAAMENQTSAKNISDLQSILNDLMHNNKVNESQSLAYTVQNQVCSVLAAKYSSIRNKGVKKAPFYVLLGAEMPAILFETAFISNKRECKRLTESNYQDEMVRGLVIGVKKYMEQLNPVAAGWSPAVGESSG